MSDPTDTPTTERRCTYYTLAFLICWAFAFGWMAATMIYASLGYLK